MTPQLNLHQLGLPVLDAFGFAIFTHLDSVAFSYQLLRLPFQSAGVFFVYLSLAFESSPVRRYLRDAINKVFFGRPGRYPGKDAGGNRSAEGGVMPPGQHPPYLVDGDKTAFRHHLHNAVDLQRRGDNTGAFSPFLTHLFIDLDDLRRLVLVEFLFPSFLQFRHSFYLPEPDSSSVKLYPSEVLILPTHDIVGTGYPAGDGTGRGHGGIGQINF